MSTKLTAGIILLGIIVVFTIQNSAVVELRFLFWTLSMSRALMIYAVLAAGMAVGWILCSWSQHNRKKDTRS